MSARRDNRLVLRNEFGSVAVQKDESANGPRLLVQNLDEGTEIYLDLLEVESLTRFTHADFEQYVRPL
jgi:hypothetical protein